MGFVTVLVLGPVVGATLLIALVALVLLEYVTRIGAPPSEIWPGSCCGERDTWCLGLYP